MILLNHLTWSSYAAILAIALVIYYALIIFQYYRKDIRRFTDKIGGTGRNDGNSFVLNPVQPETAPNKPVAEHEPTAELSGDAGLLEAETAIADIRALGAPLA